jgi:xyloglucan:xyloglucosyl transferase
MRSIGRIFVDERPIRVLRNLTGSVPGYEFPAKPMRVRASLWDGSAWATDGGMTKIDWNRAPFTAGFQGFSIHACGSNSSTPCNSPDRRWNRNKYRSLTAEQRAAYQNVKKMYMIYDYCADKERFKNGKVPAECSYN